MTSEEKVMEWCKKTGCSVYYDGAEILNIDSPVGMCFERGLHSLAVAIDMQDSIDGVRRSSMFKRAWKRIQEECPTLEKCPADCECGRA